MEKEQAFQIIDQALNIANAKGVFKLQESATIFTALNTIKNVFLEITREVENSKKPNVGEKTK